MGMSSGAGPGPGAPVAPGSLSADHDWEWWDGRSWQSCQRHISMQFCEAVAARVPAFEMTMTVFDSFESARGRDTDVEVNMKEKMLETLGVMRFFSIPKELKKEILQFQHHVLYTSSSRQATESQQA